MGGGGGGGMRGSMREWEEGVGKMGGVGGEENRGGLWTCFGCLGGLGLKFEKKFW